MNDDFLHTHRRAPDAEFGAALYQQLLDADEMPVPAVAVRPVSPKRPRLWLRLAAAILLVLAAGVVALQSANHTAPPNLAQIDTRLLLDDLPLITPANASQLLEVAQVGKGRASAVAYAPDGKTIAVAATNGIALYAVDLQSAPRLLRAAHDNYARPVAFSVDGKQIATLDGDAVRIWDTASGAQTALLDVDAGSNLSTLQFSPDGHWLAAGGGTADPASFSLYVWHAPTGNLMGKLNLKLVNPVEVIAFSPDVQNLLAVQTSAGSVFYDPALTMRTTIETTTNNQARGLAFSPNGSTLAIAHQGAVALWNANTRQSIQTIPVGMSDVTEILSMTYSPNGSLLAIGDLNYGISVWDVAAGKFLRPPQHPSYWQEISNLAFSPDSSQLAVIRLGKTISVQNARTGTEIAQRTDYTGSLNDLSLSADNVTTATFTQDGIIQFHDLKTGELIQTLDSGMGYVSHIAFTPDGQSLVASGYDFSTNPRSGTVIGRGIKLFNWKTGDETASFGRIDQWIFAFAFAPDGRLVAYDPNGSQPRTIWWDVAHPDQEHILLSDTLLQAQELQFSRDGSILATYGYANPGQTHLFDTVGGEEITIPGLDQYAPDRITLSPDGTALALLTSSDSITGRTLTVFDLKYKAQLYQHHFEPGDLIYSIAFSPDGKLIAAAGQNRLIVLDASGDKQLYRSEESVGPVNKLVFSSDGRYMVGSGVDGYIHVWGVML